MTGERRSTRFPSGWTPVLVAVFFLSGCLNPLNLIRGDSEKPPETIVVTLPPVRLAPVDPAPNDPFLRDARHPKVQARIMRLYPKIEPAKAGEYARLFIKYSRTYDLDLNMLVHMCFLESRFDEKAISRTGDYGLMQINWVAHRRNLLALGIDQKKILDPETNVDYACRFIAGLERQTGSMSGMIKRFCPAKAAVFTRRLTNLMSEFDI